MGSMEETAQLQDDIRRAVVRLCQEKFREGVEVDGIICICRGSAGEQFVVKLHERVPNGLSKLSDAEAAAIRANYFSNGTSAASFFTNNGLLLSGQLGTFAGARHEIPTPLGLLPPPLGKLPGYHHQQPPVSTPRSPYDYMLNTSSGRNVSTTCFQHVQPSPVSLWTPPLLSASLSSLNVASVPSSTGTPAGSGTVKTECDDEQQVLDYSSKRPEDEPSFNVVPMSFDKDNGSPPTESACSDEDDLVGTRRLKSLLSRPSQRLTSTGTTTQVPLLSLRKPLFFNQPSTMAIPECKPCSIAFSNVEFLRDHNETVHAAYTCTFCYRTFTSRSNLERHLRLHTGLKPYVCVTCGKAFSRKDHLSNHATKHAFKCGRCLKRFGERSQLQQHYQNEHNSALQHVCAHCNKGFSDTASYGEHQKMHPDRRRGGEVACARCDFSSNDRLVMLKHSRLHAEPTVEYSVHCSECDEDFRDPVTYSEHASVHQDKTGVFVCVICGFRPNTYDELRVHEVGHDGDCNGERMSTSPRVSTPHMLPCSQGTRFEHLNAALLQPSSSGSPTGDVPRVCSVCPLKFESERDLRAHEHITQHGLGRRTLMKRKMEPRMERAEEEGHDEDQTIDVMGHNETSSINPGGGHDYEEDNFDEDEEDEGGTMMIDEDIVVVQPESPEETAKQQLQQRLQLHFPLTKSPVSEGLPPHSSPETVVSHSPSSILPPPPTHSGPLVPIPLLPPTPHPSVDLIAKPTPLLPILAPGSWSLTAAAAVLGGYGLYVCSICNGQFAEFSNCESHCVSAHTRYPCMFCERTFAQKANRDRHTCIHTGQRPYECSLCGEKFARGDKLKLHKQKMHEPLLPTSIVGNIVTSSSASAAAAALISIPPTPPSAALLVSQNN